MRCVLIIFKILIFLVIPQQYLNNCLEIALMFYIHPYVFVCAQYSELNLDCIEIVKYHHQMKIKEKNPIWPYCQLKYLKLSEWGGWEGEKERKKERKNDGGRENENENAYAYTWVLVPRNHVLLFYGQIIILVLISCDALTLKYHFIVPFVSIWI